MNVRGWNRNALLVSSAIVSVAAATPAAAQTKSFDVPAQSVQSAVTQLGRQADIQIIAARSVTRGARSTAVRGNMTVEQALSTMLQGTGLTFRQTGPQTFTVIAVPRSSEAKASSQTASSSGGDDDSAGEEIVVTGTNIRGVAPIGSTVNTITRTDIEKSGYGRLTDVLETLPQNFGGVSEDFTQSGILNFNRGTEVQLRGLGPGTTLVLVNGRRQPSGGLRGEFVDISGIAASAVERVEVLADGASAIYGSDAIGGVVNIVLRKDYDGAETRVRVGTADGDATEFQVSQLFGKRWDGGHALVGYQYYHRDPLEAADRPYSAANGDLRRFGGSDFRDIFGKPGNILDPNTFLPAFAIPSGQDGRSLTVGQLLPGQTNYSDYVTDFWILPRQDAHSAFLSIAQDVGGAELFADVRYENKKIKSLAGGYITYLTVPESNPYYLNPFGGTDPVFLGYNFIDDLGPLTEAAKTELFSAVVGASIPLTGDWNLTVTGSYGRGVNRWTYTNLASEALLLDALAQSDPAVAFNGFGDGADTPQATLDAIRASNFRRGVSTLKGVTVLANGSLAELPGGSLKLAIGADYWEDRLRGIITVTEGGAESSRRDLAADRNSKAAYGELAIPLVSDINSSPGFERLRLSLAARYEDYSDAGKSFNPKIGIDYSPVKPLTLRGTWGTSFRAPPFYLSSGNVGAVPRAFRARIPDPKSATGQSFVLVLSGANPDLNEETADIWTLGADLDFTRQGGPRISATYFNIDYSGKIQAAGPQSQILNLEGQFAPVITRNPTAAEVSAVCSLPTFTGSCAGTIAAVLDLRAKNLSTVKVDGIDFDLRQAAETKVGTFYLTAGGTYLLHYDQALTETSPVVDVLNTVGNPLRFKARARLDWVSGGWNAGAGLNYVNSYEDRASGRRVDSDTTVDLALAYRFAEDTTLLAGTAVQFSVTNLFNSAPPFVDQFSGYDPANFNVFGRRLSLQVTKQW